MQVETINRVKILPSGELFLGLGSDGNAYYQYIYREACGVYWDPVLKGFKSTDMKEWTASQWFTHIVDTAQNVGIRLVLSEIVQWDNVSEDDKILILQSF
jgi:hypothetical protein